MGRAATSAIARRTLADARVRDWSYALLFALLTFSTVSAYRSDYPTLKDRLGFAHAFAGNTSVRLFYGEPFDLLSVGGFAAWRAGGFLSILAGTWGILAAVKALRGEEDTGRFELVVAAPLTRRRAYLSVLAACAAGAALIWLAMLLALIAGRLPAGQSAYLALATLSPAPVFLGVGALASQLAPTRRVALELSCALLLGALVLRVVADTTSLHWLRWLTPLGWSENLRAFTGARPAVLVLPAAASLISLAAAGRIWLGRDVGRGLLPSRDSAPPRRRGLSSVTALALREERGSFAGWLLGSGFFALIIGLISKSVSSAGISAALQRQLQRLGAVSILKPSGYIGLCFLFFLLAISLFSCSQVAAARHEESQQRLETVLALPLSRRRWLGGRMALALAGILVLSLTVGVLAFAGASGANAHVAFASMLEASINCVPVAALFLAIAALAFALLPRASSAIAYGLVAVSFVWQLISAELQAPPWLRELSPFEHVGLVPAQQARIGAAAVMLALAAVLALAALWRFGQRDLTGA